MTSASAVIVGTGMSVPERVMTNFDLEKIVDTSDQWITSRSGIKERRIAGEDETLSKFATEAGQRALDAAGVDPQDVGLLVLATVTPDMPIPATACTVQHQLGCRRAAAFDISAGCSGFIYAQSIAKQFLLSARSEHALVIGAELLSKYLDWTDRTTCVLFADGAGAAVMSRAEPPRGVLASSMHSDGSMDDYICMPGGGTMHPPGQKMIDERLHYIRMKGNETFKMAVRCIEDVCREVLDQRESHPRSDVDWFIPHQANRAHHRPRSGNGWGSTMSSCLHQHRSLRQHVGGVDPDSTGRGRSRTKQDRARVKSSLMAAFGAGLTWAASVAALVMKPLAFVFPGQGAQFPVGWVASSPRACPGKSREVSSTPRIARSEFEIAVRVVLCGLSRGSVGVDRERRSRRSSRSASPLCAWTRRDARRGRRRERRRP